jgi:hypothetical protein
MSRTVTRLKRSAEQAGLTRAVGRVMTGLAMIGLAGCSSAPPIPDWQLSSHAAVQAHASAYLAGRDRVAAHEQQLARREVARTGDASQMARVELHFCALQAASLMFGECPGFTPLAQDAGPAEQAYAAYLAGRWQGLDKAQLPAAQQAILTLSAGSTALQGMAHGLLAHRRCGRRKNGRSAPRNRHLSPPRQSRPCPPASPVNRRSARQCR